MRERTSEDYIRIFYVYVYKYIVYVLMLCVLLLPLVVFHEEVLHMYERVTHQQKEWAEFAYDDNDLLSFSGRVRLFDSSGKIRYEGDFSNGKCNGSGTVYDGSGRKVYEGILEDNVMEDNSGTLFYTNGKISYAGEIHENHKFGKGIQYWNNGSIQYSGTFVNDQFEGEGRAYDRDGNIVYEGQFVDGAYHGTGMLYEEGDSIQKVYEGEFAFGKANGEGILYDTFGKACYNGSMVDGHISYTAFLPGTLQDLMDHFLYPCRLYVVDDVTAVVYPKLQLIFVLKQNLPIIKEEKEWKLSSDIKPKEILVKQIVLVHDDLNKPGSTMEQQTVMESWKTQTSVLPYSQQMTAADILAYSIAETDIFLQKEVHVRDHGNEIYEVKTQAYLKPSVSMSFPIKDMQFVYRWFPQMKSALYSMMEERVGKDVVK